MAKSFVEIIRIKEMITTQAMIVKPILHVITKRNI